MTIPIAPFVLVKDNIAVQLNSLPSISIYESTEATISAYATADTDKSVTTSAHWQGFDSSGNTVFDVKNPEFVIENGIKQTTIRTPSLKSGKYRFRLTVNDPSNPNPVENIYIDNTVEVLVNVVPRTTIRGSVTLDYDVLSRDFNRPLNNGQNITAELYLAEATDMVRYTWIPNTTNGALDITRNDPQNVLSGFRISNNPAEVNSNKTTVVKTPVATANINRKSLGDNPGWIYAGTLQIL